MSVRLFVGNIPNICTELDLKDAFSDFGKVSKVDIKTKSDLIGDVGNNKFAFVNLEGSNENVNTCMEYFSKKEWNGSKLYVTRARESFLERLKREREEAALKKEQHPEVCLNSNPIVNIPPPKKIIQIPVIETNAKLKINHDEPLKAEEENKLEMVDTKIDEKKRKAEMKRLESMKKMRNDFNAKRLIIKKGLQDVDKKLNKKIKFDLDNNEEVKSKNDKSNLQMNGHKAQSNGILKKKNLFDDMSDGEEDLDFQVRDQFEGDQGQKLLELQSRYKSDKRFNLDKRFMEDPVDGKDVKIVGGHAQNGDVEADEKQKQLNILEQVLGVQVRGSTSQGGANHSEKKKKTSMKLGMPRFDPSRPDHAKFLAEQSAKPQETKKKKKDKKIEPVEREEEKKVEVSKEVFYKVSDTLKDTLEKPTQFSLRSLFGRSNDDQEEEEIEAKGEEYTPIVAQKKSKNPLDKKEKNPFVYDSSASEDEEPNEETKKDLNHDSIGQNKVVWKENLFFSAGDNRLTEGLLFFNVSESSAPKERRDLKFLMKKRLHNKSRKEQMFKKKIGGKRRGVHNRRGRGRGAIRR